MATTDQRKINGVRLITTSIPVLEASVVWLRVSRFLMPMLTGIRALKPDEIVRVLQALGDAETLTFEKVMDLAGILGPQLSEALMRTTPDELLTMVRGLLQNTIAVSTEGVKVDLARGHDAINEAFGDDIGAMWLAAIWAGVHNFQNFRSGRRANADQSSPAADDSSTSGTSTKRP